MRFEIIVLSVSAALAACGHSEQDTVECPPAPMIRPVPPASPSPPPPPAEDAAIPFDVGNNLVAPDGHVLHPLEGVDRWAIAQPLGDHVFAVDGYQVDAQRDTTRRLFPPAELRRVDADHDRNEVVEYSLQGRAVWRSELDGVRSVRPPDLAVSPPVIVATVVGTLRAFERVTGKVRWSVAADADDLAIVGDTAYYVTCNEPTRDHWLYGRALADGAIRFRAALADGCDPQLLFDAHHVVAVESNHGGSTIVFDLAGHELYRLSEQVASVRAQGDDLLVVSDKRIARLTDAGKVVWSLPAPHDSFVTATEFAALPGGDLVVATYCAISDDGVELQRMGPDGSARWHVTVPGLGVGHSEYLQRVYLEVRGPALFAVSQASGGHFIEQLDLATGTHHAVMRKLAP